ncbi:MAG: TldD/PmbA family protein [Deltaproteobacteria bacterium]|nr:TldD/PmbA family protein [Deltaproteobacteria bacterium]
MTDPWQEINRQVAMTQDRLSRAGVSQYEILASAGDSVSVGIKNDQVDKYQEASSLGLALRVLDDDRPGFSFVVGARDEAAFGLAVEEALASARTSDPEPGYGFAAPQPPYPQVEVYDPAIRQDPVEAKIARAKDLARLAKEADPRIIHVHPAEFGSQESLVRLVTSQGLDLTHRATRFSAGVLALAGQGSEQEMGWESDSRTFLEDLDLAFVGREAGLKAAAYLGGRPVPDGRYDVVFTNAVAAEFLDLLAQSLLGDNVVKNRSLLAGKLGQAVVSPQVTIIDHGLFPRGAGSAPFDDEGTPQSRTVLVKGGVVEAFLFDRLWGARRGQPSTGNAVRASLKAPPGVGFTNLLLEPRESGGTDRDLAKNLGQGLIIGEIMGGHTANPVSGEFSFGASGHLVENGEVIRPVKSIALAGQVVELFRQVARVGGDLRFFGRMGAPSILVEGLSVSGG